MKEGYRQITVRFLIELEEIHPFYMTKTRHKAEQKKTIVFLKLQSILLLSLGIPTFLLAAFILVAHFYNAPITFSMRSWVQVRNLTPVVTVASRVKGELDQVFVSHGQLVQKGELLGAIQTASIKLDHEETRRNFVDKIVELHCLASLQSHRSAFKLPYDAQILIDQMMDQYDGSYKIVQCERELIRNVIVDQALEETIAALEDQSILLKNIVKVRGSINNVTAAGVLNLFDLEEDFEFPFGDDQAALKREYRDQYFPMLQLAQTQQKLQEARKNYFLRKLQKEKELETAIEQTTQEMRYLDKQLRELNKNLEDNYIYASISGIVVGAEVSKTGVYFQKNETIFTLQPIENKYQISYLELLWVQTSQKLVCTGKKIKLDLRLQPIENKYQISIILDEENSHKFAIGAPTTVSLKNDLEEIGKLDATTVTILRRPDGKLEAVLDLEGNAKRNSEIILATGYRGQGSQRFPAYITVGHSMGWELISNIIFPKAAMDSV